MNKEEIENILIKVSAKMTNIKNIGIEEDCPIGIIDFNNWEWPQGVGLYGIYKYYRLSHDKKLLEQLISWFDARIAEGLPKRNVNTTAPLLTLAFLYEETGRADYLEICSSWAQWIMTDMPRAGENGLQHIVSGDENPGEMWDDTLFMTVLFLAKMGKILNRKDYIDESVRQFLVHIKYLFDKRTGLWFHGWTFKGRNNFANALWARGNCWYTCGVVDYIDITGIDGGVKMYLIDTLEAQAAALAECQEENGMWHTLLNDPESYVETSATAGFGYGILKAVRKGYIDAKYIETGMKALEAVINNIDDSGEVQNVSYGTGMGDTLEDYRVIPLCPMAYGQALALLILGEALEH